MFSPLVTMTDSPMAVIPGIILRICFIINTGYRPGFKVMYVRITITASPSVERPGERDDNLSVGNALSCHMNIPHAIRSVA